MRFKQKREISDSNRNRNPPRHCSSYNCVNRFLTIILSIQLVSGIASANVFQSESEFPTTISSVTGNSPSGTVSSVSSTGTSIFVPNSVNGTENVNDYNGNTEKNITVDKGAQNILDTRGRETVSRPKNVSQADFTVNLTGTTPSKESEEPVNRDENTQTNNTARRRTSVRSTNVKTELYSDTNATDTTKTDDGVAAVNQSAVSTTVTELKTETETNRGEEESSTLLVLRLAQCRANCLSKKSEKLQRNQKYSIYSKKMTAYVSKRNKEVGESFSECWDTCLLLEIENGENHPSKLADVVCSLNNSTCLSGCQDACEFHHYVQHVAKNGTKPPLLAATKVEPFLSYNLSSTSTASSPSSSTTTRKKGAGFQLHLRWPESDGYLVYSVVQHVRLKNTRLGWTWRLLEQTTMGKISLTFSEKPKIENIRVLAASPVHLVHVFSKEKGGGEPQKPRLRLDPHNYDHSTGSNSEVTQGLLLKSEDKAKQQSDSWHLRKVSMVHQKFLVVTEISWDLPENKSQAVEGTFSSLKYNMTKEGNDTQRQRKDDAPQEEENMDDSNSSNDGRKKTQSKHHHNFLLTWEVSGGILKGNMVTECDRRCDVTISLWPDTVYSIQVGLIEEKRNGSESRPLNPWEFEGEPKVTMKSSFLSVNTSDAVYLKPNSGDTNESDIQSDSSWSVHSASTDHQPHDEEYPTDSKSLISKANKKINSQPISSFSRLQQSSASPSSNSIKENSKNKNLTATKRQHEHGLRPKCESGSYNWLCPSISIADLLFFCCTYGLLLIFFMVFCLSNSCQRYFYNYNQFVSHLRHSGDEKRCKLALLRDPQENFDQFPEPNNPGMKKQALTNLMEYNIV